MTDLLVHPLQNDAVVTASADGTVKYFNSSNYSAASIHKSRDIWGERLGGAGVIHEEDFVQLVQEPAAVTSLDYNAEANALLATTATGGMLRQHL